MQTEPAQKRELVWNVTVLRHITQGLKYLFNKKQYYAFFYHLAG